MTAAEKPSGSTTFNPEDDVKVALNGVAGVVEKDLSPDDQNSLARYMDAFPRKGLIKSRMARNGTRSPASVLTEPAHDVKVF